MRLRSVAGDGRLRGGRVRADCWKPTIRRIGDCTRGQVETLSVVYEQGVAVQEMDQELAPVRAQAAHVAMLQGDRDSAAASYSTLIAQNLHADLALQAVCTNNSLCARALDSDSIAKVLAPRLPALPVAAPTFSQPQHDSTQLASSTTPAPASHSVSCPLAP
jgi:hypothetical protein